MQRGYAPATCFQMVIPIADSEPAGAGAHCQCTLLLRLPGRMPTWQSFLDLCYFTVAITRKIQYLWMLSYWMWSMFG